MGCSMYKIEAQQITAQGIKKKKKKKKRRTGRENAGLNSRVRLRGRFQLLPGAGDRKGGAVGRHGSITKCRCVGPE